MHQGRGKITAIKEIQIHGTVQMRLMQRKFQSYIDRVALFDIFCGEGENVIDGDAIPGSPIEIIRAIIQTEIAHHKKVDFFASDSRQDAILTLEKNVAEVGLLGFPFNFEAIKSEAEEQLAYLDWYLGTQYKNAHCILIVDPNGPGAFPFDTLNKLSKYAQRLDVIINISEIAIKRIKGCSITKDCNWWADYDSFEAIIWELMKSYREGWVRDVVKGDNQRWRIVAMWSWSPPKNAWEKQRLYKISSKRELLNVLNGGHYDNKKPKQCSIFDK